MNTPFLLYPRLVCAVCTLFVGSLGSAWGQEDRPRPALPVNPTTYTRTYRAYTYENYGNGPYFYRPMGFYYRPDIDPKLRGELVYTQPLYSYQLAQPTRTRLVRNVAVEVQSALRSRGYYEGALDGDIGPLSRLAIRDFQSDNRLPVTGRIDDTLVRSLDLLRPMEPSNP